MDIFLKGIAGALIALVLGFVLHQKGSAAGILLTLSVCLMLLVLAMSHLQTVLNFLQRLENIINLDGALMNALLKVVGVGLIGEIAALICSDMGQSSTGKALQILTCCVILWLSLPLFSQMITLIEDILNTV